MPDAVLGLAGGHGASLHGCVQRSLLALGGEHQVRDVLPVHHAGVAGGSPPPASLGGGRQHLPLDRGHRRGPRRPPPRLCSVRLGDTADTDTRPMYGCVLTITPPPGRVGGDTGLIERTWTLGSWDYPANVDLENPWHPLPADAVHGDSKEVHLDIRIIKLNVHH